MSKQILVVDDSATVRQQVRSALTQSGFTVLEAVDGAGGAKEIESNPAIAAVVCDVNMPHMDGIEMLERVDPKPRGLPVVMLTTEGQPELIQRAKRAGAKGWIVKPFKAHLLVAAVIKLTS